MEYCKRPANYLELLIGNWSNMLKPEDVTYHLGDVHFGTEQQLKDILKQIPGKKYLVRGNHDHWTDTKYLLCGFDGVFDAITLGDTLLTHEPTFICGGVHKRNVHGHLHNLGYDGVPEFGGTYTVFNDGKHILYAPELQQYKPIHLQKLIKI